jgi:hypothetical protein
MARQHNAALAPQNTFALAKMKKKHNIGMAHLAREKRRRGGVKSIENLENL